MLTSWFRQAIFAFVLISLAIASPVQARDVATDPDGGDEIAVVSDPDGGDEATKGTKGTINVIAGAAVSDEVADDPDGGDEMSRVKTSDKKQAEVLNYIKS